MGCQMGLRIMHKKNKGRASQPSRNAKSGVGSKPVRRNASNQRKFAGIELSDIKHDRYKDALDRNMEIERLTLSNGAQIQRIIADRDAANQAKMTKTWDNAKKHIDYADQKREIANNNSNSAFNSNMDAIKRLAGISKMNNENRDNE